MSPAVPRNKEECTTKAPGTGSSEQPHSVESRSMLAHRCAGGEVEDRGLKIEDCKYGITSSGLRNHYWKEFISPLLPRSSVFGFFGIQDGGFLFFRKIYARVFVSI